MDSQIDVATIADNIRKKQADIKTDLADQTGMSQKQINAALPNVASTFRGAQVAQTQGADPTQMNPAALKALDPTPPSQSASSAKPANATHEQMLTMALMGTLPSLIGYALGGSKAGVAAGQGGQQGVQLLAQGIERQNDRDVKLAQHKELVDQKNREIASNEKKAATDEQFKRGELALKAKELAQNAELKKLDKTTALSKTNFDQAHTLRNEYMSNPMTKRTSEISDAYRRMQEVGTNGSPASDISLIYNFMKINDPGSTVREGEFATAQNAAGVPDRIVNAYNKALQGTRLSDEQRNDFLSQAQNLTMGQLKNQEKLDSTYKGLSGQYGIPHEQVLVNFGQDTTQGIQQAKDLAIQQRMQKNGGGLPGANNAQAAPKPVEKMSASELDAYEADLMKRLGIK